MFTKLYVLNPAWVLIAWARSRSGDDELASYVLVTIIVKDLLQIPDYHKVCIVHAYSCTNVP